MEIERSWDHGRPAEYFTYNVPPNMTFQLESKQTGRWNSWKLLKKEPQWQATMDVFAENVPRLMRLGFFWTPADLREDSGEMHVDRRLCWPHGRRGGGGAQSSIRWRRGWNMRMFVSDEGSSESSEWSMTLRVYSRDLTVINDFDLDWITPDMVVKATATNWRGELVYRADMRSDIRFNTIYGETPLRGWWPWPKEGKQH